MATVGIIGTDFHEAVASRLAEIEAEMDSVLDQDLSDAEMAQRIVHLYWESLGVKQKLARRPTV